MPENIDEKLSERFEFCAICLFVAFIPFCFAPWKEAPVSLDAAAEKLLWAMVWGI